MTGYNSQIGGHLYKIQYETDNEKNFRYIEEEIRKQIDGNLEIKNINNYTSIVRKIKRMINIGKKEKTND